MMTLVLRRTLTIFIFVWNVNSINTIIQTGKRLPTNEVIGSYHIYGPKMCAKSCFSIPGCLSYNYRRQNKTCILNRVDSTFLTPEADTSFMYEEKNSDQEFDSFIPTGACAQHTCTVGSKCVELSYSNTPYCVVIGCSPQVIANANMSANCYDIGCTLTYSCQSGYSASGATQYTCLDDGTYGGYTLTCALVDCENLPTIANASPASGSTLLGSVIQYSCSTGYGQQGTASTKTCDVTGVWLGQDITCLLDCGTPPTIANASPGSTESLVGSVIQYSCTTGYAQQGTASTKTCDQAGSWTGQDINCLLDCGAPPTIANAIPGSGNTFVGSVIQYSCSSGYTQQGTGAGTKTCDQAGSWTGEDIQCSASCSGNFPHVPGASFSLSCTDPGCDLTFTCDVGTQIGNNVYTCGTDGTYPSVTLRCDNACPSGYANTYTHRTNWFFNPPTSFTPSYGGGSVSASWCANNCNTRSDLSGPCVAYYVRTNPSGYCELETKRAFENTNLYQYDQPNTNYDEYTRDCA